MARDLAVKAALWIGLICLAAGVVLLLGYWAYQLVDIFLGDPKVPLPVRVGVAAMTVGLLLSTLALLVDRLRKRGEEDFKEVDN